MAIELHGINLLIASLCLFLFGALNNVSIGSYPLTMATLYTLGMSLFVSFSIMMGLVHFQLLLAVSNLSNTENGEYNRKITLFTSPFGVLGVLIYKIIKRIFITMDHTRCFLLHKR